MSQYTKSQCEVRSATESIPSFEMDLVVDIPTTGHYVSVDTVLKLFPYLRWEILSLARKEYKTIFKSFDEQGYIHFEYLRRQHRHCVDPLLPVFIHCAEHCFAEIGSCVSDGRLVFH